MRWLLCARAGQKLKEASAPEAALNPGHRQERHISLDIPGGRMSVSVDAKGMGRRRGEHPR